MGQRLGRRTTIDHHHNQNNNNINQNSTIESINIDNNNKSVIITICMLKMEPTIKTTTSSSPSTITTSSSSLNDNNSKLCNNNTYSINNVCDTTTINISNLNQITSINHINNNISNSFNSANGNIPSCSLLNDCSKICNMNTTAKTATATIDDGLNHITDSFTFNLGTSGGQLITQSHNNYDQYKLSLPSASNIEYLLNLSKNKDSKCEGNNCNSFINEANSSTSSSPSNSNRNSTICSNMNTTNTIPPPTSSPNIINNNTNSNLNKLFQQLAPLTCENCKRKFKGKLCKSCRNNNNNINPSENKETSPPPVKTSKKGNWGIGRFKKGNSSNNNNSSSKAANNTPKIINSNNTSVTNSVNSTKIQSLNLDNSNNKTESCSCSNSNVNNIVDNQTTTISNNLQTSTPQQLRTAALQFYPSANHQILVNNSSNPSVNIRTTDNNNGTANISQATALLHPANNQILQRAAFYSSNGNVGGNFILLSMNQSQPMMDFRLNEEDYTLEDCDERARILREIEIAEGVEPPPGFRPTTPRTQPLPQTQQQNPAQQNQTFHQVVNGNQNVTNNNNNNVSNNNCTTNSNNNSNIVNPATQWQMVLTPNAATLQNLFGPNNLILQNFLSTEDVPRIHSQVDYIHCLVPDLQKITSCSFYWGKMDRYEAERLLDGKPEGTFLLRDSAQEEFLFSVSFRKYARSLHARIEQFNHKFSFDSHDPGVYTASTVTGLLEHYKDPACVMFFEPMLTIPLNRNFPFSLQQLCRAAIVSNTTYDGINDFSLPSTLKSYLKEYHYKQRVRVRRFDEHTYANS